MVNEAVSYTHLYLLMRSYYSQFGLGVLTGIDVPNEAVGYMPGKLANAGNTLDFAIGQLDNYTTIELAQYVSCLLYTSRCV